MNVFGYIKRRCNSEGLVELSQVTLQSSPDTLREIASFLLSAAAEMEAGGPTLTIATFKMKYKDGAAEPQSFLMSSSLRNRPTVSPNNSFKPKPLRGSA